MANIRIKPAVERISIELDKTVKQAVMYSGVDAKDADSVDRTCLEIIQQAGRLAGLARVAKGYKAGEEERLVKKLRKVLGFTYA
jgi:hypothetical protein